MCVCLCIYIYAYFMLVDSRHSNECKLCAIFEKADHFCFANSSNFLPVYKSSLEKL